MTEFIEKNEMGICLKKIGQIEQTLENSYCFELNICKKEEKSSKDFPELLEFSQIIFHFFVLLRIF